VLSTLNNPKPNLSKSTPASYNMSRTRRNQELHFPQRDGLLLRRHQSTNSRINLGGKIDRSWLARPPLRWMRMIDDFRIDGRSGFSLLEQERQRGFLIIN
jgi:hypothetical protein